MTKKVIFIPLAVLIVAGLLTFTGCKRHGHHKGAEFMIDYVSEVLDLTDAQRADLDQIKEEFMAKAEQMHADKDTMKADILAQLEKEEMDADALKQIADLHRARMDEFIDLGIDRLVDFHKTLTPEQKAKLVQKLEDCERWHHP
jgi:Spy/CpxP family protein refolding chaperone